MDSGWVNVDEEDGRGDSVLDHFEEALRAEISDEIKRMHIGQMDGFAVKDAAAMIAKGSA